MPKLILSATALLFGRPSPSAADAMHEAMHATTRSRDATRRLRASRIHEPYFELGPLDLARRH